MSGHLGSAPSPSTLDVIATSYRIAPYWAEEIALLLCTGVSDAEILANVQKSAGDDARSAQTIPLSDERCRELLGDLKELLTQF
jgi:hypothetical protein